MASKPVDPEILQETLRLYRQHGGVEAHAAKAMGVSRETFKSRREVAQRMEERGEFERADRPVGMPFERAWIEWQKHIGQAKDRYCGPAKPRARTGRLKVVAAGDFHIPFHNKKALAELIAKEASSTDILFIGGDFGDAHCASTFTKYEHVSFEEEHAEKTLVLQQLSESFPIVQYLEGSNHPDRYEKRLRESLSRDVLAAVMTMTGGILNPDLALVKRFRNVEAVGWKTPKGDKVPWLSLVGDVAFSHAEKYSRVPGAALRSVEEWLDDFSGHLGLPPLRAVVQFHTHTAAVFPWRSNMLLIESGAMCEMQGYQLKSKIGGRPQRLGYVTMELIDGHLDVNSVRLNWLD